MITIGYSTRESNPIFQEYLKKSAGNPKVQIIEKVNNGEKNLSQVYNEIILESKYDIVVLCHDDIYFDTNNWAQKLEKLFKRNQDFGIIGVAGTTELPKSGMWWEDRTKMFGIVNHENNGKKWESRYSDSLQNSLKEVVIVDGVFISINKNKIKNNFDESVDGFHFYDVNFCFKNFLENVKIGVTTNIRLTHKSIGETNNSWEINRVKFSKNYSSNLPKKIILNNLVDTDILYFSDLENTNDYSFEICNHLNEKNSLTLISPNNVNTNKIKFLNINSSPGYRLGDGKWMVNTQNGPQPSKENMFYKIYEPKVDLIIFDNSKFFNVIQNLYPNSKKILYVKNLNSFDINLVDIEKIDKIVFNDESIYNTISIINNFKNINFSILKDLENYESELLNIINSYGNIKNKKIKILTGFSNKGGSTTSFINLTNEFNNNGYDCTLYGPDKWHLNKCKSGLSHELKLDKNDVLICHFIELPQRPLVDKVILSCHEKNLYKVSEKRQFWDTAVFLNEAHREYHSDYNGDFTIIPNLKENLKFIDKPDKDLIAGVIGSIDENKQTHTSIKRALDDGCEFVYIFGGINDQGYYKNFVSPLLSDKVIHKGHVENKQEIYDMIGRVYQSSISECASLVKDECHLTGTKFFGNTSTNHLVSELSNTDILNKWKELIEF